MKCLCQKNKAVEIYKIEWLLTNNHPFHPLPFHTFCRYASFSGAHSGNYCWLSVIKADGNPSCSVNFSSPKMALSSLPMNDCISLKSVLVLTFTNLRKIFFRSRYRLRRSCSISLHHTPSKLTIGFKLIPLWPCHYCFEEFLSRTDRRI